MNPTVKGEEMEFRDLKKQYQLHKDEFDHAVIKVMENGGFIGGAPVNELEADLAEYVGTKYCISCANGTDALWLALLAWGIGPGDAVFVPDFTFFSTAEVVSMCGATPVFVDVEESTFNMSPADLEAEIKKVLAEVELAPKVIIPVDLFGLPANYPAIRKIALQYGLHILEDGAQGFGGSLDGRMACSFGDMATTSFFPAKPLGCYGDGGAVFTNDEAQAELLRSLKIHGKGSDKYDNVRIGMNSRLDTMQAAILKVKLRLFREYELDAVNRAAAWYNEHFEGVADIKLPQIPQGLQSSWAQYTVLFQNETIRNNVQQHLKEQGIPSMIYYKKPLHLQDAFAHINREHHCPVTTDLCGRVLSLPMHPYITEEEIGFIVSEIVKAIG